MRAPIPTAALDDRLGFLGTAGAGKTYNAMAQEERILDRGGRIVHVDPLGVSWGLRLMVDGKTESGYRIVIFGGEHADLPLTEQAGALIGETVAGMAESCIIDLSLLGTKAAERRFMLPFLTALYRHADKRPVHLIFDEADMFAPQRLLDKEADAAKLLGMMETIVRRGRIKGFIPWLITQRPAVLSKNVLSQVDGLIAFKLTSSQDRDAIGDWVEGQADKATWRELWAGLPTMQRGQGLVWVPGRGIIDTVMFPPKKTFDSSRTPERGERQAQAELKPLNVEALKGRLAKVVAEVEENDPQRLKGKIADLERKLKTAPKVDDCMIAKLRQERDDALRGWRDVQKIEAEKSRLLGMIEQIVTGRPKTVPESPPKPITVRVPVVAVASRRLPALKTNGSHASLPKGERAVLIAAAQHGGITREHLTVATGYKRSSRDAYIQRLRERNYVEQSNDRIVPTEEGLSALGSDYDPLPTGADLREHVLQTLPEGERKVLAILVENYPDGIERTTLDELTGYQRSSRDAYLQRLRTRELIEVQSGGIVRAADELF